MSTDDPSDRGGFPLGWLLTTAVFLSPAIVWLAIDIAFAVHRPADGQAALSYLLPILMTPVAWALVAVDLVARAGWRRLPVQRSPALLVCWVVLVLAASVLIVVVGP